MRLRAVGVCWSFVWAVLVPSASAQAPARDTISFSRIEIAAGASSLVLTGGLGERWRASPGFFLSVVTPYGPGALRIAVEGARHRALTPGLPDHTTLYPSLEWGLGWGMPGGVRSLLGVGLGALWMNFNEPLNPTELEMATTGSLHLRRGIAGGWVLGTGASVRRIFFSRPTNQATLSLEIGRVGRILPSLRQAIAGTSARPEIGERVAEAPPAEDTAALPGPEHRAGGRIIGEKELRDRGVLRLAEVFRALPGWDVSTVDQRAVWTTPDGLSPLSSSAPKLFVDGVPLRLGVLGSTALDRLPLSLEDLRTVEAVGAPSLSNGRFQSRGAVHFRTRLPASNGLEVFAGALAENATGDPGPYLYTDSTAANVDKLGTGNSVGLRWRLGAFGGSAGTRSGNDLVTDPRLGGRTLSLRDPLTHYPVIRTRAEWVSLRWEGERGGHDVRAGRSQRSDYLFIPALGSEVPTESSLRQVGAAGWLGGPVGLRWEYQLYGSWNELAESPNDLDLDFDLRTASLGAQTALAIEGRRGRISLGAGMEGENAASGLLPAPVESRTPRGSLSGWTALGAGRLGIDLEARRGHDTGRSLAVWTRTPLPGGSEARTSVWHHRSTPEEATGFWALHDQGYAFLESAGVDVESRGPVARGRESGMQLEWMGHPIATLKLTPFVRMSRVAGLRIAEASFLMDGKRPAPAAPVRLASSGAGDVLAAGAEARWVPSQILDLSLRYRWLDFLSGDALLRSAWLALPRHRWSQRIAWSARSDLRVAVGIEGSSSTYWEGYERIGIGRLPGVLLTDLSLEKTIWDERVRLRGRVLNLLDQKRPLHPLGSAPGLSFAFGATARLGR